MKYPIFDRSEALLTRRGMLALSSLFVAGATGLLFIRGSNIGAEQGVSADEITEAMIENSCAI